jgi:hypothetical protein
MGASLLQSYLQHTGYYSGARVSAHMYNAVFNVDVIIGLPVRAEIG